MSHEKILSHCDQEVKKELGYFIREFNKREWSVRIAKSFRSFEDYASKGYIHQDRFGVGFVVNGKPVPYFHPNRSFHDEIIWLNNNLYYKKDVSFNDKLINSAIVKFYGPSRTLDIITGFASDLKYLKKTDYPYINFDRLLKDEEYEYAIMSNIELASQHKQQIWGTTELRTSLQTAARDHARKNPSIIDRLGLKGYIEKNTDSSARKMRASDMIHWIKHISFPHEDQDGMNSGFTGFFRCKPTMEDAFYFLTLKRGIGNYYGYHFASNLARMPGVGAAPLIEKEWSREFKELNLRHGALDENDDFVVAGPGACATLKRLFPGFPINQKTTTRMILAIRDNQEEFFGIKDDEAVRHLREATELGKFTTFGVEISCCQFNVFSRLLNNSEMASNRAKAPISKEAGERQNGLMDFIDG